jgi:hypothetical protein
MGPDSLLFRWVTDFIRSEGCYPECHGGALKGWSELVGQPDKGGPYRACFTLSKAQRWHFRKWEVDLGLGSLEQVTSLGKMTSAIVYSKKSCPEGIHGRTKNQRSELKGLGKAFK